MGLLMGQNIRPFGSERLFFDPILSLGFLNRLLADVGCAARWQHCAPVVVVTLYAWVAIVALERLRTGRREGNQMLQSAAKA
jgi:hypothetical protein